MNHYSNTADNRRFKPTVPAYDIIIFYFTCIRPVLQYCVLVFHHAHDLERVQKRGFSIISLGVSFMDNLTTLLSVL